MFSDTLNAVLHDADALLIVPPFTGCNCPTLGVHLLQACAGEASFDVCILYASLLLASDIGEADYNAICHAPTADLHGERFFAHTAYGIAAYDIRSHTLDAGEADAWPYPSPSLWNEEKFRDLSILATDWVDELTDEIARFSFKTVGCTTSFEQTAASVAILNHLKRKLPYIVTILGGANCEGRMAEGIRSLDTHIDYIFSGECEQAFPQFLQNLADGTLPADPVITGSPCADMDSLPVPDFSDYYAQYALCFNKRTPVISGAPWLPYETSRKSLMKDRSPDSLVKNEVLQPREKSPERVLTELHTLLDRHPSRKVYMADDSMPSAYFHSLLPSISEEWPDLHIIYGQKTGISLARARLLKQTGVHAVQVSIDALSTTFLMAMKKGVTTAQNIAFLRYTRAVDIQVNWSLLYDFPGDRLEWYEKTIALIPLLAHLPPPSRVAPLCLDRHSPYFLRAPAYGIQNMRPIDAYFDVLPSQANINAIACYFIGDYPSESRTHPTIIAELVQRISAWQKQWKCRTGAPPSLTITPLTDDQYMLTDTRGLPGKPEFETVNRRQATIALTGVISGDRVSAGWAMDRGLCVQIDGRLVPLTTADPEVLEEFETAVRQDGKETDREQHTDGNVRHTECDSRQMAVGIQAAVAGNG